MTDPTDFDALYRHDPDPFSVASSWYERRKERILLAGLTGSHYRLAWDCAAGTGHLASRLAECCDQVIATDASPTAVELVASLTSAQPWVSSFTSALPEIPAACRAADLTVVAEVLYYLPAAERSTATDALTEQVGELVTVHWRHHPDDAYLSGAAVTHELDIALKRRSWESVLWHEDLDFVLAAWRRGAES